MKACKISICCTNIEGFEKYKHDDDFLTYATQFDIFAMCETWGNNVSDFDDVFDDYEHFSYVRSKHENAWKNSGGVTVYTKKQLVTDNFITRIFENILYMMYK